MSDRGLKRKGDQIPQKSSKPRLIAPSAPSFSQLPPAYGEWEDPAQFLARHASSKNEFPSFDNPEWETPSQFLDRAASFSSSSRPSTSALPSAPSFSWFEPAITKPTPSAPSFSRLPQTDEPSPPLPTGSSFSSRNSKNVFFSGIFDEKALDKPPVRNGVRVLPSLPSSRSCSASPSSPSTALSAPSSSSSFSVTSSSPPSAASFSPSSSVSSSACSSSSSSSSVSSSATGRPPWSNYFSKGSSSRTQASISDHQGSHLPRNIYGGVQVLPTIPRRPSHSDLAASTSLTAPSQFAPVKPHAVWRAVSGFVSLFAHVPSSWRDFEMLPSFPWIAVVIILIFILTAVSIQMLPFWIAVASSYLVWLSVSPQRQTVHIFVDHSNIIWSSAHQRLLQSGRKLSYPALVKFLRRPKNLLGIFSYLSSRCLRRAGTLFLAGSVPATQTMQLETHPQWEEARKAGFEIRALPRIRREHAVDDVIHKAIATTVLKSNRWLWGGLRHRDVVVIVSGDANDNEGHGGFPQQASLALDRGLDVEVWGMSDSLGRRGYAALSKRDGFRMFALDPYLSEIYASN